MIPQQPPSHLPSLPQVLAHILDAVFNEEMDFQQLAEILHQDPAITARVLTIANSTTHAPTHRCHTVERALLVLGLDMVKTIVITAATRQFFNSFGRHHQGFLKAFWQRSLTMASLAQRLARLIGYRNPDQAYLGGLLADLGQLILLQHYGQAYLDCYFGARGDDQLLAAEQAAFSTTHSAVGAALVNRWQIDPILADALAQHHDDVRRITAAPVLVKLVNLASRLSLPQQGVQHAGQLLGLNEELVENIRTEAWQQVRQLAQVLDIDTDNALSPSDQDGYERLGQRLSEIWQLQQTRSTLSQPQNREQLHEAVQRVASLITGVEQPLLLLPTADGAALQPVGTFPSALADVSLPLEPNHGCSSDAFLQQRTVDCDIAAIGGLGNSERELLHSLGKKRLLCLPLLHDGQSLGVLAFALDDPLPMSDSLLQALAQEIARALAEAPPADEPEQDQQRIAEAVHEASNPLTIINNYLEVLRLKLRASDQLSDEISLLQEEIKRVGDILLRLKTPQQDGGEPAATVALNPLTEQLVRILDRSLFAVRGLRLELQLDPRQPVVRAPAGSIKQILINLLKNAAEALSEGGVVKVATSANVLVDGLRFAVITVEDNGTGIPLEVMNQLFSSPITTKGEGHAELGLSICKRLVDALSGKIVCESGSWGTRFQVLIPQ